MVEGREERNVPGGVKDCEGPDKLQLRTMSSQEDANPAL